MLMSTMRSQSSTSVIETLHDGGARALPDAPPVSLSLSRT